MDATNLISRMALPYDNRSVRKDDAVILDIENIAGIGAVGTHDIFNVPRGRVIDTIKIVVLKSMSSGGSANVKFLIGGTDLNTALVHTAFSAGTIHNLDPSGKPVVNFDSDSAFKMLVSGAALTACKVIILYSWYDSNTLFERG